MYLYTIKCDKCGKEETGKGSNGYIPWEGMGFYKIRVELVNRYINKEYLICGDCAVALKVVNDKGALVKEQGRNIADELFNLISEIAAEAHSQ